MIRYQIFCGLRDASDKKKLEDTVAWWFEAATIMPSRGLWRGTSEDSNVIEILVSGPHVVVSGHVLRADNMINNLAKMLKRELGQEAVIVATQKIDSMKGYGIDGPSWTFEERLRNWVWDRMTAMANWQIRNRGSLLDRLLDGFLGVVIPESFWIWLGLEGDETGEGDILSWPRKSQDGSRPA